MYSEDEIPGTTDERGSDDLLSDDNLRLPENANPLVRLHAVRAWLTRRQNETEQEIGLAALDLQRFQQEADDGTRLRRREQMARQEQIQHMQQTFQAAQQRLETYAETSTLLEDCVDHTTVSERLLVEFYLVLDNLLQTQLQEDPTTNSPRAQALMDVLQRVENVGTTIAED